MPFFPQKLRTQKDTHTNPGRFGERGRQYPDLGGWRCLVLERGIDAGNCAGIAGISDLSLGGSSDTLWEQGPHT